MPKDNNASAFVKGFLKVLAHVTLEWDAGLMFPSLAYRNVLLDSLAKRHGKLGTKQEEEKIFYGILSRG